MSTWMFSTHWGGLPSTAKRWSKAGSRDAGAPVDAQRLTPTRNQKQQCNPWVGQDVAQAVHPVVATALGQQQGVFVLHHHKTGWVTPRRRIQPPPGPLVANTTNGDASIMAR